MKNKLQCKKKKEVHYKIFIENNYKTQLKNITEEQGPRSNQQHQEKGGNTKDLTTGQ